MLDIIKEKNPEAIEWKKEFSPILEIPKAGNPIGYSIKYVDFSKYTPELNNQKLPIENPELRRVLESPYSRDILNLKNTDPEKVKGFVIDFIKKNPKFIEGLDISNLTPSQASTLAGKIVAQRLIYDYDSIKIKSSEGNSEGKLIQTGVMVPRQNGQEQYWSADKGGEEFSAPQIKKIAMRLQKTQDLPIEELLAKEKYAVCRHYSRAFTAIFDALKTLQKGPGLQNTYSINVGNDRHAFNLIATIESGKKINMTVVDPTSADVERQSEYDTKRGKATKLGFNTGMFDATSLLGRDANRNFYQQLLFANLDFSKFYKEDAKYGDFFLYRGQLGEIANIGSINISIKSEKFGGILNKHIGGGREIITKPEEIREFVFGL